MHFCCHCKVWNYVGSKLVGEEICNLVDPFVRWLLELEIRGLINPECKQRIAAKVQQLRTPR